MPDRSADALQAELTRLVRLAADAHAAGDLALVKLATDEAAKCRAKLTEARSTLRVQDQQPPIEAETDTQADTDKGNADK